MASVVARLAARRALKKPNAKNDSLSDLAEQPSITDLTDLIPSKKSSKHTKSNIDHKVKDDDKVDDDKVDDDNEKSHTDNKDKPFINFIVNKIKNIKLHDKIINKITNYINLNKNKITIRMSEWSSYTIYKKKDNGEIIIIIGTHDIINGLSYIESIVLTEIIKIMNNDKFIKFNEDLLHINECLDENEMKKKIYDYVSKMEIMNYQRVLYQYNYLKYNKDDDDNFDTVMQLFKYLEESLINQDFNKFKTLRQVPIKSEFMKIKMENMNQLKNNYIQSALIYLMGKCVNLESME